MDSIINRTIIINGLYYQVVGERGDYYKCKALKEAKVTFDDGIEIEFSHPHVIYYQKKFVLEYYVGERKWLV